MTDIHSGLVVSADEAGQKLLNFLRRRIDAHDGDLHRWIRTGQVRINGSRAKAFDHVSEGAVVRVPPFASARAVDSAQPPSSSKKTSVPNVSIVYEDRDILVLNKPAGLSVQGGRGHDDCAAARVAQAYACAPFIPAPAHRLDRDTSGLLVFGKTYASLRFLSDAFSGRAAATPRKDYLAWIDGTWDAPPGELRDMLALNPQTRLMEPYVKDSPLAYANVAEARLLAFPLFTRRIGGMMRSLLMLRLLTGRKHQIRAQLCARGHPVCGDPWYGKGGCNGLKLHAFRIVLPRMNATAQEFELLPPWKGPWHVPQHAINARP